MSRSIVIVARTISFCVLANVVCGTQYYWNNGRTRNPRYASCPSCHRDCPDALSSLWYPRQDYSNVSPSRNYRRSYGEWTPEDSTFYPRNGYGRSSRSGSANPMDVTASRTTNSRQYREPFERDRPLRRIDPYLASEPTTSSLNQENSFNLHHPSIPRTNLLINNNYERQNHQARKFSHESTYFENDQESFGDRSSILNENPYRNQPIEVSRISNNVGEDYPKASLEKFLVVYRADRDGEEVDEEEENALPFERSDSTDSKIASERYSTKGEEPFATSNLMKQSADLSLRSNVARMMKGLENINRNENTMSLWQNDGESSNEEIDKSFESLTRRTDYYVSSNDGELANESTKTIQSDVSNNEEEKLLAEQAIKTTETKGEAIEEGSLKFDPDFVEDIENPPVEPTEPTTTNEATESSMTEEEHS